MAMDCKNCRNYIDGEWNRIHCEAHSQEIEIPEVCAAYLPDNCRSKKRIEKNNDIVDQMWASQFEE